MGKPKIEQKELERVPLLVIYKHNGKIYAEQPDEKISQFELLGFLEVYIKELKELLHDTFEEF